MHARLLLNLVLLLVVAGIGIAFWLDSDPEEATTDRQPLAGFDVDTIDTLRIERPASDTLVLQRDGDRWWLQQPYQLPADANRVRGILLLPQIASEERFPAADHELARFGLETPILTVYFDDKPIALGDESPIAEERYVLHDNMIHLISDRLYAQLNTPATYYIDGALLPESATPVRITLPDYTLTRTDDDWASAPTLAAPAQAGIAARAWQNAYAVSARPYEPDATAPLAEIRVDYADATQVQLLLIADAPRPILVRPDLGIQYHLDADSAMRMLLIDEGAAQSAEQQPFQLY